MRMGISQAKTWSSVLLLLSALDQVTSGAVRQYFIASNDVVWDYAPEGTNLADPDDQATADVYLQSSDSRIGHKYKKASYFQFTDGTFTEEIPKSPNLGILGPIIRAEVGDTLQVTYFNNASRPFSLHPHGVFYLKDSEGATYLDGTSGKFKGDNEVQPGQTITMTWEVTDLDAPTEEDPNCIPFLYHSHVITPPDTSTGVTGILITCKKGILDANNKRTDVDEELPLFVKNYDENMSWYADDNIALYCGDPDHCRTLKDDDDEEFVESNYMRSINGYMFGHLPDLEVCVGHRVSLYIIGFGNEFDVHSMYIHGQTLKYQHTKGDTVSVYSATFIAAEMTPHKAGKWKITDMVGTNQKVGLSAFLTTKICEGVAVPTESLSGVDRDYFISVDEVAWNYGPEEVDGRTGALLTDYGPSEPYFRSAADRIGGSYTKAVFRAYTDGQFDTPVARPEEEVHLGILGPVVRAEVGDKVTITLRNKGRFDVAFLAHGLSYHPEEEANGDDGSAADTSAVVVKPGMAHTYKFTVPDDFLATVAEPCLNFLYTSDNDPSRDHNSGLVGPIVICQRGYLNSPTKPKEFFLLLSAFDENESLYFERNVQRIPNSADTADDADFYESNLMFSINGFSFGNIPGLDLCLGESVSWYVMSLGSDIDVHTVTFEGNTVSEKGKHRDGRQLVPGQTAVLSMKPDNLGRWEVMSQSTRARDGGMYGFYEVTNCQSGEASGTGSSITEGTAGKVRDYFVAAEEVLWNYVPNKRSIVTGQDLTDPDTDGNIFVRDDDMFIGSVYEKAVFRGYTDGTFSTQVPVDYENILGPTIKGEVGDLLKVTFFNNASRSYSIHSRGVRTRDYEDGKNYKEVVSVSPGERYLYHWEIPGNVGPGPSDPACIPWLYYSTVDQTRDVNSGLVGTLVVCRPGTLDDSGRRKDVDKELSVLMSVMNENLSWYLQQNIQRFATSRLNDDYSVDADFEESNLMHAVNGRMYGNNPELFMEVNSKVAWYMMSVGAEVDLHSFHLHGHTFVHISDSHREDVLQVFPGQAEAVVMVADNPGTWLLHCHVLDHIEAGMTTTYTVLDSSQGLTGNSVSSSVDKRLKCWACSTFEADQSCENPTEGKTPVVECEEDERMCRKVEQHLHIKGHDEVHTFRHCAKTGDLGKCAERTGTYKFKSWYCQCEGDLCNSSVTSALSLTLLVASLVVALSFKR